jgi:hypothetical protein
MRTSHVPPGDEKTEAQLIKRASRWGNALNVIFATPGKPSRRAMAAMKKHALAMIRYELRLKLAGEQSNELLSAPILNKGSDYVVVHREEKLRALLQKYKIDPSSGNAYYLLSLQLAIDFHPGFKLVPLRQRQSGVRRGHYGIDGLWQCPKVSALLLRS